MQVNFPDRSCVRIDTINISRTSAGLLEGQRTPEQLRAFLETEGHKIWNEREKVQYFGVENPGRQSVWCWLTHENAVQDATADGSQAFLAFTCDPLPLDAPLTDLVQTLIDRAEITWDQVAQDFWY